MTSVLHIKCLKINWIECSLLQCSVVPTDK